jgi:hypothetical protein
LGFSQPIDLPREIDMRTCTVMIYTDGTTSRYAVMRGPMRGKTFDSNAATKVAVYELTGAKPDYVAMTARHVTPHAPAVPWQCPELSKRQL